MASSLQLEQKKLVLFMDLPNVPFPIDRQLEPKKTMLYFQKRWACGIYVEDIYICKSYF